MQVIRPIPVTGLAIEHEGEFYEVVFSHHTGEIFSITDSRYFDVATDNKHFEDIRSFVTQYKEDYLSSLNKKTTYPR